MSAFIIATSMTVPWLLHFAAGWWAGILSWIGLIAIYDRVLVGRDSLCMGIPFMLPLCSFMMLLGVNFLNLVQWLMHR